MNPMPSLGTTTLVQTVKEPRHLDRTRRWFTPEPINNLKQFLDFNSQTCIDPFSDETIEAGELLMNSISESRREKWMNLLESLDMKQNSRRAWKTVKNLSNELMIQKRPLSSRVTLLPIRLRTNF